MREGRGGFAQSPSVMSSLSELSRAAANVSNSPPFQPPEKLSVFRPLNEKLPGDEAVQKIKKYQVGTLQVEGGNLVSSCKVSNPSVVEIV